MKKEMIHSIFFLTKEVITALYLINLVLLNMYFFRAQDVFPWSEGVVHRLSISYQTLPAHVITVYDRIFPAQFLDYNLEISTIFLYKTWYLVTFVSYVLLF